METILITGANGFVGRHLLAELLAGGEDANRIVAVVRPGSAVTGLPSGIAMAPLDVRDAEAVKSLIARVQPSQIYHLAARTVAGEEEREAVFAVNVQGTRNVLEAAARLEPFPRTLVISSGAVYGETDAKHPAHETTPVGPLWRYGALTDSKMEMEIVARAYRGFVMMARSFPHIGPGQQAAFPFAEFAHRLARIERGLEPPVVRIEEPDTLSDLLDGRDVARAYRLLMALGVPGEAYNVATGRPLRRGNVYEALRRLCAVPTEATVAAHSSGGIGCSTGDPLGLWATTGWQPRYTLEQTLRDTLDTWRAEV